MSACVNAILSTAANVREEADFAARVAETQRRVFQIALSVLRNPADAEDVAQEAYLQAFRRFSSLRDPASFRAWVGRIAFRLALNRLRGHRRRLARDTAWFTGFGHGSRFEAQADGARDAYNRLYVERLAAEIERLPEKLRAVLLLSTVEDMDAAEVAAVLEIPPGTVRSRLHLARKRLLEVVNP